MRRSCGRPRLRFWSARYEQIRRRGLPVQQSATACDVCARPRTAQGGSFEGLLSIAYAMDFFWIFGAARGWRQADMMRADGGEVRQRTVCRRRQRRAGRPARGERESAAGAGDGRVRPAAAAPGETLEGAVSAAVAEDGRRLSETVEDGRGRSRVVEDGRRHGGRGERSDKARRGPRDIYCCGGVAARGVVVSSLASRFEPGRQSKICCCSQGCCAGGFFHRSFPRP